MQALCGNDPSRPLKVRTCGPIRGWVDVNASRQHQTDVWLNPQFEVFDWDRVGEHDVIGAFTTTAGALSAGREYELVNPAKQAKAKYRNSGVSPAHPKTQKVLLRRRPNPNARLAADEPRMGCLAMVQG
jgi:hypothetical protein